MAPQRRKVAGALLKVLKSSTVAWYRGEDGTRAYYAQPTADTFGEVIINGRRIAKLHIDAEGLYWDRPSPEILRMMASRGVDTSCGWTGTDEIYGEHINEAMKQSHYAAVRHHTEAISVQKINNESAAIFVNGRRLWIARISATHTILEELGVETWKGWHPVQQDLLQEEHSHGYRRELI